jgi:hypothetical protein
MKKFFQSSLAILVAFSSLLLMPIPTAVAAADTCTWDGSASAVWSNGANWSGCDNSGVPEDGDKLIFPASAANKTNSNDIAGLDLVSITFSGEDYEVSGNAIDITPGSFTPISFTAGKNTYSLPTTINSPTTGTSITSSAGFNEFTTAATIAFNFGAGFDMNFNTTNGSTLQLGGVLSGATQSINYSGNVILGGANINTYTGGGVVNINQIGVSTTTQLTVGNVSGLGVGDPQVNINGQSTISFDTDGTYANTIRMESGFGNSPSIESNGVVTLSGTIRNIDASGAIIKPQSSALTLSGPVILQDNTTLESSPATTTVISGNVTISTSKGLTVSGQGTPANTSAVFSGLLIGSGQLVIGGGVEVDLDGDSTDFDGNITLNSGSRTNINQVNSLGTTVGATIVNDGATLASLGGNNTYIEPIALSGIGYDGTGSLINFVLNSRFEGSIDLFDGDATIGDYYAGAGNGLELAGEIISSGPSSNLTFTGGSSAQTTVEGTIANTYSGNTIVDNHPELILAKTNGNAVPGNLIINSGSQNTNVTVEAATGNTDQIANTGDVSINNVGVGIAALNVNNDETIGSLTGNGELKISPAALLTIGSNNTSTTFTGTIDDGFIAKTGTGNLTLNGTAPTPPNISVEGGTLTVLGNYALTPIVVGSGAALKGTGTVYDTVVNGGGTLSIGTSPGCMNFAGLLTLSTTSTYTQEIASATPCSGYDVATVTGIATLNNAALNIVPSYTPNVGQVFTILTSESVVGIYNGLPDNSLITVSGLTFRINYTATTVTLTFISGTLTSDLAPTGQNSNQTALLAFAVLAMALAGLGLEYGTRRRKHNAKV